MSLPSLAGPGIRLPGRPPRPASCQFSASSPRRGHSPSSRSRDPRRRPGAIPAERRRGPPTAPGDGGRPAAADKSRASRPRRRRVPGWPHRPDRRPRISRRDADEDSPLPQTAGRAASFVRRSYPSRSILAGRRLLRGPLWLLRRSSTSASAFGASWSVNPSLPQDLDAEPGVHRGQGHPGQPARVDLAHDPRDDFALVEAIHVARGSRSTGRRPRGLRAARGAIARRESNPSSSSLLGGVARLYRRGRRCTPRGVRCTLRGMRAPQSPTRAWRRSRPLPRDLALARQLVWQLNQVRPGGAVSVASGGSTSRWPRAQAAQTTRTEDLRLPPGLGAVRARTIAAASVEAPPAGSRGGAAGSLRLAGAALPAVRVQWPRELRGGRPNGGLDRGDGGRAADVPPPAP